MQLQVAVANFNQAAHLNWRVFVGFFQLDLVLVVVPLMNSVNKTRFR